MLEYAAKAAAAWFLGFFPFAEIYVAVPAAVVMGLDPLSAVVWPVLGNWLPVPLILFAYEKVLRVPGLRRWLSPERRSARFERLVERHGNWLVLVITPWIGIWVVAATARVAGMKPGPLLAYSFLSVLVYAVVIVVGIGLGLEVVGAGR
jgi:uncharacterized membrane protein